MERGSVRPGRARPGHAARDESGALRCDSVLRTSPVFSSDPGAEPPLFRIPTSLGSSDVLQFYSGRWLLSGGCLLHGAECPRATARPCARMAPIVPIARSAAGIVLAGPARATHPGSARRQTSSHGRNSHGFQGQGLGLTKAEMFGCHPKI